MKKIIFFLSLLICSISFAGINGYKFGDDIKPMLKNCATDGKLLENGGGYLKVDIKCFGLNKGSALVIVLKSKIVGILIGYEVSVEEAKSMEYSKSLTNIIDTPLTNTALKSMDGVVQVCAEGFDESEHGDSVTDICYVIESTGKESMAISMLGSRSHAAFKGLYSRVFNINHAK